MMTLYSGTTDPFSQRCRIVLHEKGMDFQIIDVDLDHKPEDLPVMNPYNQVPVLVERDLVLHESNIINEYIDERFPHPQLMPADPVMRARARLFLHRFEKELFCHIDALEGNNQKQLEKARGHVRDSLMQIAPVFAKHKHMLGDEYSMLDVAITPLLWRLDYAPPHDRQPRRAFFRALFRRVAGSLGADVRRRRRVRQGDGVRFRIHARARSRELARIRHGAAGYRSRCGAGARRAATRTR